MKQDIQSCFIHDQPLHSVPFRRQKLSNLLELDFTIGTDDRQRHIQYYVQYNMQCCLDLFHETRGSENLAKRDPAHPHKRAIETCVMLLCIFSFCTVLIVHGNAVILAIQM